MYEPEKLKPCPFCGGEADYRTENFGWSTWVQCTECGARTSQYPTDEVVDGRNGKQWAAHRWQTRR